ncbi:hypothetical protein PoB_007134500 [Plakobranchus ocellatus]|uniref:Uncharacterized protein n=1 Tax=Plakobranchus ocellatus TaxID=259542 RepID=A0AAV4DLH6_9GAST|nr:hypothetical protein PoB_007134500 [Plakobranchus ocellatus]
MDQITPTLDQGQKGTDRRGRDAGIHLDGYVITDHAQQAVVVEPVSIDLLGLVSSDLTVYADCLRGTSPGPAQPSPAPTGAKLYCDLRPMF